MSNDYEGRDTVIDGDSSMGDEEVTGSTREAPIKMDLPDIERDSAGIPTFIFHEKLKDDDRPSSDKRALQVVLLWREAVMSVGHYNAAQAITVGDSVKNDFRVAAEGLPVDRFHLLDADDTEFVVNWTDSMAIEVRDGDGEILDQEMLVKRQQVQKTELDGFGKYQYKLGLNDRVAVQVGEVTFVLEYVSPARRIHTSLLKAIDYYFAKILSLSFLGHAFLLLALLLTPIAPMDLDDDLFKNPNRFAKLILKEPEKAPKPIKKLELSGSKGGGRHKDEEGKFGKKDKPKRDALASTKGAPTVDPNKREKDRKIAMETGIFKTLGGGQAGAVSNVFGPGGLGTGINNAMGGLRGTAMGDAGGAGGLGMRGTGPGGGGNSLGIGGLGSGTGRGTGGMGDVDLGGRGKGNYKVVPGRTVTQGCLSQQMVLRVITRAQSQAKYCYSKELQKNPNLEGKITTAFVVGATGEVTSVRVTGNTMAGGDEVEQCLTRVINRLRFPPCKGGGTADITYPWIFKSGN